MYGREIILDVVDAKIQTFTRKNIKRFLEELCRRLGLERADLHFWDYDTPEERDEAPAHLAGVSAVQFVTTSSIVVHTLDKSRQVFVNVFGCGEIDAGVVTTVTQKYFGGRIARTHNIERGLR